MLIRLKPVEPNPNVLFGLTFSDLPESMLMPANWAAQLQRLACEELEVPSSLYALDLSASPTVLLDEVTFDIDSLTISCVFIDGTVEEWPIMGSACLRALEGVLDDVNQSAAKAEMKKEPEPIPTSPIKTSKHKKQRSLLMALIASLVPSSSSTPSKATAPLPTPPPTPTASPPTPALSAIFLRRRARSTLVDVFRRYVLSELSSRAIPGGYPTWIARSMLRRVASHMEYLVQEAGIPDLMYSGSTVRQVVCSLSSATTLRSPLPFCEDDSNSGDADTDTDGSSIHTPSESPSVSPLACKFPPRQVGNLPRTPSPQTYSPEDLATYSALAGQYKRLRNVVSRMDAYQRNLANDDLHLLSVLEIKSKRRAWSNREFMGGALVRDTGLATPFRSSPLARFAPRTLSHLCPVSFLEVTTGEHDVSRLFPVTEEDETVEDDDALRDLEAGLGGRDSGFLDRPQIRPRTRSMHRLQALELDPGIAPEPPTLLVPPSTLSSSSLLFQPLKNTPRYDESIRAPVYDPHHMESDASSEFTLAMDLPLCVRDGLTRRRYPRDDWLPGIVVDCR